MVAPVARPVTLRTWLKSVGIIALVLSAAGPGAFASSAASKPVLAEPRGRDEHSPDRPQEIVEKEDAAEEGESEVAPDAMRDPLIAKAIRRRVLIDKPRFSMETGGKIQVQYYDSDSADSENEDDLFLRRIRPFLMGHFATHWKWKAELEQSSQITNLEVGPDALNIRDLFVRYEGFERAGARLTLGNSKAPFSRDFMWPSTRQLFVERTSVGSNDVGVPDRLLGVHFRRPVGSGKAVLWASLGSESLEQDARAVRFESTLGASNELNRGWLAAGRLDLQPGGPRRPDEDLHFEVNLAGYYWSNDGSRNTLTEDGMALDPERPDLDSATGLELSGTLDAGGLTLAFQYNRILADTVADDFTSGIYLAGETELDTSTLQSGYRLGRSRVQLTAGVTRLDTESYLEPWNEWILGVNLDLRDKYLAKLQITNRWISNRFGLPGEDFLETRLQVQYVW